MLQELTLLGLGDLVRLALACNFDFKSAFSSKFPLRED